MASSGYTAITFVANEQPTTAKWNLIGSNDASFNNGNGFEDGIIVARHMAADSVDPAAWTNPYVFRAYTGGGQTIPANVFTKLNLNAENYDNNNNFNTATYSYTAPVTGIYNFSGRWYNTTGTLVDMIIALYINNAEATRGSWQSATSYRGVVMAVDIKLNAGDVVDMRGYAGAGTGIIGGGSINNYLSGHLVSPL